MDNLTAKKPIFDIKERTLKFSVSVIQLVSLLPRNAAGFAIAGQIVRSGTSVGANIEEAQDASSRKDFIHCLTVSLKEARETQYWLRVIKESSLIPQLELDESLQEITELIKILTTIVKKSKLKLT